MSLLVQSEIARNQLYSANNAGNHPAFVRAWTVRSFDHLTQGPSGKHPKKKVLGLFTPVKLPLTTGRDEGADTPSINDTWAGMWKETPFEVAWKDLIFPCLTRLHMHFELRSGFCASA